MAGRGNPFLAAQQASQAGAAARAPIMGQLAQQQSQMRLQERARFEEAENAKRHAASRMLGGVLGAGSQLLGMVAPALGPMAPAAGAGGAVGGMLGGAFNGMGRTSTAGSPVWAQQQTGQAATPAETAAVQGAMTLPQQGAAPPAQTMP